MQPKNVAELKAAVSSLESTLSSWDLDYDVFPTVAECIDMSLLPYGKEQVADFLHRDFFLLTNRSS